MLSGGRLTHRSPRPPSGLVRRAAPLALDALMLLGVVFSIPLAILGLGLPIALIAQLLIRIARLLFP
jgi:hypothetical protein